MVRRLGHEPDLRLVDRPEGPQAHRRGQGGRPRRGRPGLLLQGRRNRRPRRRRQPGDRADAVLRLRGGRCRRDLHDRDLRRRRTELRDHIRERHADRHVQSVHGHLDRRRHPDHRPDRVGHGSRLRGLDRQGCRRQVRLRVHRLDRRRDAVRRWNRPSGRHRSGHLHRHVRQDDRHPARARARRSEALQHDGLRGRQDRHGRGRPDRRRRGRQGCRGGRHGRRLRRHRHGVLLEPRVEPGRRVEDVRHADGRGRREDRRVRRAARQVLREARDRLVHRHDEPARGRFRRERRRRRLHGPGGLQRGRNGPHPHHGRGARRRPAAAARHRHGQGRLRRPAARGRRGPGVLRLRQRRVDQARRRRAEGGHGRLPRGLRPRGRDPDRPLLHRRRCALQAGRRRRQRLRAPAR